MNREDLNAALEFYAVVALLFALATLVWAVCPAEVW